MNNYTCFIKQVKNFITINMLRSLIILAIIIMGVSQLARDFSSSPSISPDNDCTVLASLSPDYTAYSSRPNKNSSVKNHEPVSRYSVTILQASETHDLHLFNAKFTQFRSYCFKQFNHAFFLQDLPPPSFS
jgi:hypothetical protein